MVTIKDVARQAQVSPATVSNALTGKRPVSEDARQRILQAIEEMGYQPNFLARGLVNQRTDAIAVVASGLEFFGPSRTLAGIQREVDELGYSLMLNLLGSPANPEVSSTLANLMARWVDGVIWAVPEIGNNRAWIDPDQLRSLPPIVFLNMQPQPGISVVSIDNRSGARRAVQHLLEQGRRKIGLITGPLDWWEARERYTGWLEAVQNAGLLEDSFAWVVQGDWNAESGERGLVCLLEQHPDLDAIFACNDQMALGVLRAAQRLGRQVPQDLAVVGFDDIPEAAYFSPSLTTVFQDLAQGGRVAVNNLHLTIQAKREGQVPDFNPAVLLEPALIVRDSTRVR